MWKKVEYSYEPTQVDETSSRTTTYLRKNIVFVEATDTRDAHWEADERTFTKEGFATYLELTAKNEKAMADIDYVAMMTDVDIPTEETEEEQ